MFNTQMLADMRQQNIKEVNAEILLTSALFPLIPHYHLNSA